MSTHDMVYELAVAADRDAVMTALTSPEGIRGWWAARAELEGDALRPEFPGLPQPFELEVAERSEDRLVWNAGDFPPPWKGTSCVWLLEDAPDGGTTLHFSHREWGDGNPMIGRVTLEWAYVLDHLKRYVETGVADPRVPAEAYDNA